jgi:hypothetical protein
LGLFVVGIAGESIGVLEHIREVWSGHGVLGSMGFIFRLVSKTGCPYQVQDRAPGALSGVLSGVLAVHLAILHSAGVAMSSSVLCAGMR